MDESDGWKLTSNLNRLASNKGKGAGDVANESTSQLNFAISLNKTTVERKTRSDSRFSLVHSPNNRAMKDSSVHSDILGNH